VRILTVSPEGLKNGNWRHAWELSRVFPKIFTHAYTNELTDKIFEEKFDLIIFAGALTNNYQALISHVKASGSKVGVLFCSPIGQAELSNEIISLNKTLLNNQVDFVFVGSKTMESQLRNVYWLPQIADLSAYPKPSGEKWAGHVSLFCSSAPHKNICNQLLFAKKENKVLHTNALNKTTRQFADIIGLKYYSYDFLNYNLYLELISKMEYGLQMSFSEAFDYVVLDHLMMGTKIYVSDYIKEWVFHKELLIKPNLLTPRKSVIKKEINFRKKVVKDLVMSIESKL